MTTKSTKTKMVNCPQCGALTKFDDTNPQRPFCSERCRNFDTASWATGSYRIAGKTVSDDEMQNETNANEFLRDDSKPDV